MAKSVLDIAINIVKAGTGDVEAVKSLNSLKSAVGSVTTVFGALGGAALAVNSVYQNTLKVFIDYASQIRDLSRVTGMGAEETSKLVQAADDLDITFESLSKSLWNASKKGIDVSVASLSAMADEFVKIENPAQQAVYLTEKFGKSGADMGKLLKLGADGVNDYVDSIEGSLVLTEEQIHNSEMARLALDSMADAWEGVKVAIGSAIGEMIAGAAATKDLTDQAEQFGIIHDGMNDRMKNSAFEAFRGQMERGAAMTAYYNSQMKETTVVADEVAINYGDLFSLTKNLSDENMTYTQRMSDLNAELARLNAQQSQFKEGSKAWSDVQGDIDKTKASISDLAAEHDRATKQMIFGLLQQKMAADGLSEGEYNALIKIGQGFGIIDDQSAAAAMGMNEFANSIVSGMDSATGSTAMTSERMAEIIKQAEELSKLTGKPMKFFIDIAVQGNFPFLPGTTGSSAKPRRQGGAAPEELASGGQLGNGWTLVGEEGEEVISPSGWVFTAEETRALKASGLLPEFSRALGGDVYNNGSGTTTAGIRKDPKYKPGSKSAAAYRKTVFNNDTQAYAFGGTGTTAASEINNAALNIETSVTTATETTAAAVQTSAIIQQQMLQNTLQTTAAITQGNADMVAQQTQTNALLRTMQASLPGQMVAAFVQANP